MSEAKHTKGPWFVLMEADGHFEIRDAASPDLANTLCTRFAWAERKDEMLANAHLISSAPDLLEALQELADCGAEAWGADRPCVADARAAIAKATGSAA